MTAKPDLFGLWMCLCVGRRDLMRHFESWTWFKLLASISLVCATVWLRLASESVLLRGQNDSTSLYYISLFAGRWSIHDDLVGQLSSKTQEEIEMTTEMQQVWHRRSHLGNLHLRQLHHGWERVHTAPHQLYQNNLSTAINKFWVGVLRKRMRAGCLINRLTAVFMAGHHFVLQH